MSRIHIETPETETSVGGHHPNDFGIADADMGPILDIGGLWLESKGHTSSHCGYFGEAVPLVISL
jgi:hypothetical protein